MPFFQLSLQNVSTASTKCTFCVSGATFPYHVYVCEHGMQATPTNWTFKKIAGGPFTSDTFDTPLGTRKYFYFYLACSEDRGNQFMINNPETPELDQMNFIIQGRMDTGDIVIEDDLDVYTSHLLGTIPIDINSNGCGTITLPDTPELLPKSYNKNDNMVYLINYVVGGKHLVQGAICTVNDIRFHQFVSGDSRVKVKRLGLELFANTAMSASLPKQSDFPIKIYAFKASEIPNLCKPLFPFIAMLTGV